MTFKELLNDLVALKLVISYPKNLEGLLTGHEATLDS